MTQGACALTKPPRRAAAAAAAAPATPAPSDGAADAQQQFNRDVAAKLHEVVEAINELGRRLGLLTQQVAVALDQLQRRVAELESKPAHAVAVHVNDGATVTEVARDKAGRIMSTTKRLLADEGDKRVVG